MTDSYDRWEALMLAETETSWRHDPPDDPRPDPRYAPFHDEDEYADAGGYASPSDDAGFTDDIPLNDEDDAGMADWYTDADEFYAQADSLDLMREELTHDRRY